MKRIKAILSDGTENLATVFRVNDNVTLDNVLDHVLDFDQPRPAGINPLANFNKFFEVGIRGSDAISRVGYNFYTKELYVQFKGGNDFIYDDVPEALFLQFIEAPSKGQFYNQNIKGQY